MAATLTIDDVASIALSLPGAEFHLSYGRRPSWRTQGGGFTGFRDDGSLLVWVESQEEKQAMIEAEPEKFFSTPHYDGYPIVLVRLGAVDRQELQELVVESWRQRAPRRLVNEWDANHR